MRAVCRCRLVVCIYIYGYSVDGNGSSSSVRASRMRLNFSRPKREPVPSVGTLVAPLSSKRRRERETRSVYECRVRGFVLCREKKELSEGIVKGPSQLGKKRPRRVLFLHGAYTQHDDDDDDDDERCVYIFQQRVLILEPEPRLVVGVSFEQLPPAIGRRNRLVDSARRRRSNPFYLWTTTRACSTRPKRRTRPATRVVVSSRRQTGP